MVRVIHKVAKALRGEVTPPPDKSISHRAVMMASLSNGKCRVSNFLRAEDTVSTLDAFRRLGINANDKSGELVIEGRGLYGINEPYSVIDCGNSGTTMRLMSGILSGNGLFAVLSGDESLCKRPMGRVIEPLSLMGARIMARGDNRFPPVAIKGGGLRAIEYKMPISSAQVKSSILLAALYADGETSVLEPLKSRDHTERMLKARGAEIDVDGKKIKIRGGGGLEPADVDVPNDFSSAAFFIAAALLVLGSEIKINAVGINPTRTGLLAAVSKMGANIIIENERSVSGEPVADLVCRHSELKPIVVSGDDMPAMIDEFPVLCVLAACAKGTSKITGAGELRVKESDRITAMAKGLMGMGVSVEELEDGIIIDGGGKLNGALVESFKDHRIAMAFSVAGLCADGDTSINDAECVGISYPGFYNTLEGLL